MPEVDLKGLAKKFGLNIWIVSSWYEKGYFKNVKEGEKFFTEKVDIKSAQPFVKWVGGKRQLIPQLQELFPKPTEYNNYFEPFVGAGAVFFNLQRHQSFLSDVNEELINIYKVIQEHPRCLISQLKKWRYAKKEFLRIRARDRKPTWKKRTKIERAARFMYLNRTCFNGMYRVNSLGQFNVPFGAYTNPDFVQEKTILTASRLLNETAAQIEVESFERVLEKAEKGDFIYFDPPYDTLTSSANFTSYDKSGFGTDMQVRLAEVYKELSDRGVKLMLSNHNTPLIQDLYKGFKIKKVKARRNINSKASGRGLIYEVVVLNY